MPTLGIADDGREVELLRHAADVLIEVGLDGRIVYMSDAIERILARGARAFVGRSFLEIIIAEDREEALAVFQKIVTTGAESISRFRVPRRDGLRVEFEATTRVFKGEDGARRIVCTARDVTQQSIESAVARERDLHYRTLVESGSRPAAIVGTSGEVIFSNQNFKSTFGRDVNLETLFIRMSEEDRHRVETAWFESIRAGHSGTSGADFEFIHDDGRSAWFSMTWETFLNDDGQRRFSVLYQDISKRKKIEYALRSIASGTTIEGRETLQKIIKMIAQALEFDRIVLGRIDVSDPGVLIPDAAWQDDEFLDLERFELADLPDSAVARGETVIYPAGLAQLVPSVGEQLERDFECYAGMPLRRSDGAVIGLIGGYGRKPISDPELTRSLLSAFATHAAAALDRRQANEEIRANQDRFDVLARQAHEMLVEVDQDGLVTFVSQACLPLLGYRPEELVGRDIHSLTHPDDRVINQESRAPLFNRVGQTRVVTRVRHARGGWRWLESRTSAFRASDGVRRALILSRDVTDQRRHELGRDLLFRIVQQSADLLFVCEPDSTRLTFANNAATRRLAASTAAPAPSQQTPQIVASDPPSEIEIEGRTFHELLPPDEAHRLREKILPGLTPSQPWSGELQLLGVAEATLIPTEATFFLFEAGEKSLRTYLGITLRDIGARRTAEEALRQSEIRLNQAQKMEAVGRLAGGIAHDFNNLLTAIIGYSDLVLDELDADHVAQRDVEEILRAAERAGGLTRQLLAFSRRQILQPESVDLNAVVADIDRMMRRLIGENIDLVTVQDGELRPIVADPGQIEQVIVNLVVNARDAMPQGGRLEIETANHHAEVERRTDSGVLPAGDYVLLRVSDTGVGMDEATRAQIFEPFFTTKKTHQGTGLGLASVNGIVNQSGGQIDVDTTPGRGTRFTVYFPAARAQATLPDATGKRRMVGGNETILLVEDAPPVLRLVQRTLEKAGYKVLPAESATAALRHCSRYEGPIDLILTDVVLPKTAGPEIARRASELRPGIRVLFMSGFTDDTLIKHGLDPARSELLEKPFSPAAVLERIRTLLDAGGAATQAIPTPNTPH